MSITEATIRNLASSQSFSRGEDYYHSGEVYEMQKRGNILVAEVAGSSYEPYQVTIELTGEDDIISTDCTCPYDWGGECKHIVAVLLAYLHEPDQVTERTPVEHLLADLGEAELRELLTDLLTARPHLIDWIESKLAIQVTTPAESSETSAGRDTSHLSPSHPTPIDPAPFRRQAQQILRRSDRWDYFAMAGVANQMLELANQAVPFMESGEGHSALAILEAITEPYVDEWYEYDDSDGELGASFSDLGMLFTEAILSTDLTPDERKAIARKLTTWQGEIDEYGVDGAFDAAIAAAEQGWDFPPLQKVLQGHITNKGAWEDEAPWFADELAVARLNVLERQGRTTEYLYLAEAEGQTALYLMMLVKLDRSQEAVEHALQYAATTDEAMALAQLLRQHDLPLEGIKIAQHGLTLHGETLQLTRWLRDFAAEQSKTDVALKAAQTAFARSFSLEDYQAAELIAGAAWSSVKADLLQQLAAGSSYGKIEIYLHEGMVDEAVQAIDQQSYVGYDTLERVVEVAWQSHPDWVIRQSCQQAERIMDAGQSKYYHHALRWLEQARQAYLGSDRAEEWSAYLEGLITKHARKYSLRPGLEALRV